MSKRTEKLLIWTFVWSMGWFGAIFIGIFLLDLIAPQVDSTSFGRGLNAMKWLYPVWFASPILGFLTALVWFRKRNHDFAKYQRGHCQSCGYDLTGNQSGICSECGTPRF